MYFGTAGARDTLWAGARLVVVDTFQRGTSLITRRRAVLLSLLSCRWRNTESYVASSNWAWPKYQAQSLQPRTDLGRSEKPKRVSVSTLQSPAISPANLSLSLNPTSPHYSPQTLVPAAQWRNLAAQIPLCRLCPIPSWPGEDRPALSWF